jgi:ABC-type transport system involved in multi-copper enzyme maturation permease subunit
MKQIITIAVNTFRESIRDKVFYSLLFFAILMLGFSMVLGNLTIGDPVKIIKDFGLGSISLFGTLIAIFVGISLVYKEIEKKTIYVILAKPVARWQFLVGKYLGLLLTLVIEVGVMTIGLFALCYSHTGRIPWELVKAIVPICFELQLILAVALFFSTFATPFLSGVFTMAVFIIGHLTGDLKILVARSENANLKTISEILYYTMPNLENLNFKAQVVHGLAIPLQQLSLSLLYAASYTVVVFMAAIIIFSRRDIR